MPHNLPALQTSPNECHELAVRVHSYDLKDHRKTVPARVLDFFQVDMLFDCEVVLIHAFALLLLERVGLKVDFAEIGDRVLLTSDHVDLESAITSAVVEQQLYIIAVFFRIRRLVDEGRTRGDAMCGTPRR